MPMLRPEEQVFEAMLEGWTAQQLSRGLREKTITGRLGRVTSFQQFSGEYPWAWHASDYEDWIAHLRSGGRSLKLSTLRGYENAISLFCGYLTDLRYAWAEVCEVQFGDTPSQIVFEWNTAAHVQDYEGRPERRALRPVELQTLLDVIDDEAERLRAAGKKGWLTAVRDSAALKTAYAFGLRRQELAWLDIEDIGPNPHAPEFNGMGVVYVRHGKASRGSAPKRRSVLTVMPWSAEVLEEWLDEYRPRFATSARGPALWPSERGARVAAGTLGDRFKLYRNAAGLPQELGLHCLRHSYVTHLIEAGFDPFFVQQQVGHAHASTTSIYTSVSSHFRTQTLRAMLDKTINEATN